jgi:hypothetical protein
MYRIIYLPTAFLVSAYLDDVTYTFLTEKGARAMINSRRVVYCKSNTKNDEKYFVYINSVYTGENVVPTHLLDVIEVE